MSRAGERNYTNDSHALVNRSGARRPSILSRIRRDSEITRDTTIHFEFQGIVEPSTAMRPALQLQEVG